jgi:hypothetical protein
MAYGLLGHCKPGALDTEVLIYRTPQNKKAVGSLTLVNSDSTDARATVICISEAVTGSVSGTFLQATGGVIDGVTLLMFNALCKGTPSDPGTPVSIKGVVLGPGQALVAYNNTGTELHYVFNGIEEAS